MNSLFVTAWLTALGTGWANMILMLSPFEIISWTCKSADHGVESHVYGNFTRLLFICTVQPESIKHVRKFVEDNIGNSINHGG